MSRRPSSFPLHSSQRIWLGGVDGASSNGVACLSNGFCALLAGRGAGFLRRRRWRPATPARRLCRGLLLAGFLPADPKPASRKPCSPSTADTAMCSVTSTRIVVLCLPGRTASSASREATGPLVQHDDSLNFTNSTVASANCLSHTSPAPHQHRTLHACRATPLPKFLRTKGAHTILSNSADAN